MNLSLLKLSGDSVSDEVSGADSGAVGESCFSIAIVFFAWEI